MPGAKKMGAYIARRWQRINQRVGVSRDPRLHAAPGVCHKFQETALETDIGWDLPL